MDTLRIKCNKVERNSRGKEGRSEETTGSSGQTFWTKGGGGGGRGVGDQSGHTHIDPRFPAGKGRHKAHFRAVAPNM